MDILQRFIFDGTDIRGQWVSLDDEYQRLLRHSSRADFATALLGEFLAASVLLSATLKFKGRLVLQAKSDGLVPLIMAECDSKMNYRGIIKTTEECLRSEPPGFTQMLEKGTLAITIEPDKGERYQGIVPIQGSRLSSCIEHYFYQSEQLNTRLFLVASAQRARGLLLQQLPAQIVIDPEERDAQWQHLSFLAETLKPEELLELPCVDLLYRLYHQDDLRLLEQKSARFLCACNRQRVASMLLSLGREALDSILEDEGKIEVDCEFCHQQYCFLHGDVAALFGEDASGTVH